MNTDIISIPLHIPKIEPKDWVEWWDVWKKEAAPIVKVQKNHNSTIATTGWAGQVGFDLYADPNIVQTYAAKNIDRLDLFPSISNNIEKFPMDIKIIRVASSLRDFAPHYDYDNPYLSIRSLLHIEDENYFKFFYNTPNGIQYQKLPKETNTWAYWDHKVKHGSVLANLNYPKIMIMYYGIVKLDMVSECYNNANNFYKDYIIKL
jgi:hypothetical protein